MTTTEAKTISSTGVVPSPTGVDEEAERSRTHVPRLIARLDELASALEQESEGNEQAGVLSDRTLELLREAELPLMLIPESVGGFGMFPRDALEVLERLAQIDASIAWIGGNWGSVGLGLAYFPADVTRQLLEKGQPLFGATNTPTGRATPVEGGFRVSGSWAYGSGDLQADYIFCTAIQLSSEGEPLEDPLGNPLVRMFVVRGADITPRGNWDTLGLRATGSVDFSVDDVFVPHHLVVDLMGDPVNGGRQQAGGMMVTLSLLHTSFALGATRRLLDELTAFARQPNSRGVVLADDPLFRAELGRQEVAVRSARAYVYESWDGVDRLLKAGERISRRNLTHLKASMVHLHQVARELAIFVFTKAGGKALRAGRIQRWVRDTLSACQHLIVQDTAYADVAWELMGAPENLAWGPFNLLPVR